MIRVFILDNPFLCSPLKSRTQSICYNECEELEIRGETKLPAEGLPNGYDLYSLHISLIRPPEQQVINSADEWCSNWIGESLEKALKGIIEKRRSELP